MLGANNLSTCLGMSLGARRLRYSQAIGLASIGLMAGILLEGGKLAGAITGVASTSDPHFAFLVTISSFILMAFLTYRRLPISLSQVAVGAAIGAALAEGIQVNWKFTILVASSWILTPIAGFLAAYALSIFTRRLGKNVKGVLTQNVLYSYLTIMSGVYASYTLGANTVGLIIGMVNAPKTEGFLVSILLGFATIIGMVLLSRGTTLSVAENIIGLNPAGSFSAQVGGAVTVHGFTQFGIPVSVSQAVVGGIFGAAIPRKIVIRNDRLTREIILGWTAAPVIGAVLALILSQIL
jgi:PiT family inorganic phosphate transporter